MPLCCGQFVIHNCRQQLHGFLPTDGGGRSSLHNFRIPTLPNRLEHTTARAECSQSLQLLKRVERLGRGCRPALLKAFATEHGAPLRRTERNRSFLAAARADGPSLYLAVAVILSRRRRIGTAEYRHAL